MPNIDTEEAHVKTERNDKELPTCTKSRSANDDAIRTTPANATDDPTRPMDRNASELPT